MPIVERDDDQEPTMLAILWRHVQEAELAERLARRCGAVNALSFDEPVTGGHMAERKRELIEPKEGDKRYIRRDEEGHFTDDQVDVGRSLTRDRQQHAKKKAKPGHGDKGDR